MEKIMIINGSPRAFKSNSKKYAEIFIKNSKIKSEYFAINKKNHLELCHKINSFSKVLFIFPLYVDSLPVGLMKFLKTLEKNPPTNKPTISVLINCGFIEPYQNDVAIKMMQLFCKKNGYHFGSVLQIGSGEAILKTPFKSSVNRKIKKLAKAISKEQQIKLTVTMPLPKKIFIKASTNYWKNYGKTNNLDYNQLATMEIEKEM